jgi:hypothetical protein
MSGASCCPAQRCTLARQPPPTARLPTGCPPTWTPPSSQRQQQQRPPTAARGASSCVLPCQARPSRRRSRARAGGTARARASPAHATRPRRARPRWQPPASQRRRPRSQLQVRAACPCVPRPIAAARQQARRCPPRPSCTQLPAPPASPAHLRTPPARPPAPAEEEPQFPPAAAAADAEALAAVPGHGVPFPEGMEGADLDYATQASAARFRAAPFPPLFVGAGACGRLPACATLAAAAAPDAGFSCCWRWVASAPRGQPASGNRCRG